MDISPFVIIKFINERHVTNFRKKGEIHFEKLQYFRDKEINELDTNIGDRYEAHIVRRISSDKIKQFTIYLKNKRGDVLATFNSLNDLTNNKFGHAIDYKITSKETSSWNISCFTILRFDDKEVFEHTLHKEKSSEIHDFSIKESYLNKLYKEVGGKGRKAILIFPSFLRRVESFGKSNDFSIIGRSVQYYSDYDDTNVNYKLDINDQLIQAAFSKSYKYKKQKEFRFLIFDNLDKTNGNINIGNLEQITAELDKKFKITIVK